MHEKARIGIALTGSFCTLSKVLDAIERIKDRYDWIPIMSNAVYATDTRFGTAAHFKDRLSAL